MGKVEFGVLLKKKSSGEADCNTIQQDPAMSRGYLATLMPHTIPKANSLLMTDSLLSNEGIGGINLLQEQGI